MERSEGRSKRKYKRYGVSYIWFFLAMAGFLVCAGVAVCFGFLLKSEAAANQNRTVYTVNEEFLTLSEALSIMQDQYNAHQSNLSTLLTVAGIGFAVFSVAVPLFNYAFLQKEQVSLLHARIAELEENIEASAKMRVETDEKLAQVDKEISRMRKQIEESQKVTAAQVDPKKTKVDFKPISDDKADIAHSHYMNALRLFDSGKYEEALIEGRKAVELEPDNAEYRNSLGATLDALKRYEEAFAEKQKAVELEPDDYWHHGSLSATLDGLKRYDEALIECQKAVELEPDSATYHNGLGWTLYKMKRYEEALAEGREAVRLDPSDAESHDTLGVTLHAMERYEEALIELQKAVELAPDNAEHRFNLGKTLHDLNRRDEAAIEIKKAIALDPTYIEKAKELGYIDEPNEMNNL